MNSESASREEHVTVTIPANLNGATQGFEHHHHPFHEARHSIPLVEDSEHKAASSEASLHSHSSPNFHREHHYNLLIGKSNPLYTQVVDPVKTVGIKSTKEAYDYLAESGYTKQFMPIWKIIWLGLLAGFYIGIGYALASVVGGQLGEDTSHGVFNLVFGAIGLPVGLTMVVLTGAELFTSNTTYLTVGLLEGRVGLYGVVKSWILSWFANLLGALLLVWMLKEGQVFTGPNAEAAVFIVQKTSAKTHLGWGVAVLRGILCNWLVNMAVFQSVLAQDLTGKFIGIWLPISTFMMLGFEHSVANQFFLSMGVALSHDVCATSNTEILKYCNFDVGRVVGSNLIPVTLGNIIGGSVFVALALGLGYGAPAATVNGFYHRLINPVREKFIGLGLYTWPLPRTNMDMAAVTKSDPNDAAKLLHGKSSTITGLHGH